MNAKNYGVASGLRGFQSTTLRVRVLEVRDGVAFVVTADLLDAGTHLVLDPAQVVPESDTFVTRHRDGLVTFEGGF